MQNSVSLVWAAKCRRRRASLRACFCQSRRAPQVPARSSCSAAQSTSAVRSARIQSSRSGGIPQLARARARGACGGASSAMGRWPAASRGGRRRRSSPTPGCCTNNSTSVPTDRPAASRQLPRQRRVAGGEGAAGPACSIPAGLGGRSNISGSVSQPGLHAVRRAPVWRGGRTVPLSHLTAAERTVAPFQPGRGAGGPGTPRGGTHQL